MKHFAIAGRLGGTPQLETKGEGSDQITWARMRVAVNSGQDKPDWFWVTAFGKLAENIAKHLVKGDGVALRGEPDRATARRHERSPPSTWSRSGPASKKMR